MEVLSALGDPARWQLVGLLAERPRPVGVLAELAGARQPQTTKHLQTLERAGVVSSLRTGQRRIYALRPEALRELATALEHLAGLAETSSKTFSAYGESLGAERGAAQQTGWADGRAFRFERILAAGPAIVWRHLTEPDRLAAWWAPDDLRVSELVFEARPGGRIVQEYRDAEDTGASEPVAGRAVGVVDDVRPGERLAYRLSPLLPDGSPAFTAHVTFALVADGPGTALAVDYRITGSATDAADFIAGIEIGFGQSLDRLTSRLPEGA
ncbi:metalloregulator ArsR/SmtB family transcription factor [Actinoplanes bogorensis]|uniref:Metalloregulator ArsR/SmtB family transcription factor n=1 Tax=Paractinoplanes bogorensis TaxID=1610840 RepID=A0ABS5YNU3_9ACTN|nr:metalloregulator ArsR/SmtB family transcription factor [Actinoplanes bogorensis]MBU2665048.1 metalloregulator ArsR/SmtB family transcription factor [Actinoplanes bogorensis]